MTSGQWYTDGLRFSCTRCGRCCTGTSGVVRVSDLEIEALAQHLELSDGEFRAMYTRRLRRGDVSLREQRGGDCVFYDSAIGCRVYTHRPRQCRTWPFWRSVVESEESWVREASGCPGMNAGCLYPPDEIRTRTTPGTPYTPAP